LAIAAFGARYPSLVSDVPAEPATNHAAVGLQMAGFSILPEELGLAGLVVSVPVNTRTVLPTVGVGADAV
jgi:hypothetical protein